MGEHEKLRWFLIKKFICLLVAVGMVESVLLALLNAFVFPTFLAYFFPHAMERLSLSGFQLVAILILMFFTIVIAGIQSLLPQSVGPAFLWLVEKLDGLIVWLVPSVGEEMAVLRMDNMDRIFLLLCLFVTIFVITLPFLAAAFVYTRMVTIEFAKIQMLREETKLEFDRKRNLLLSDIAHDLRTPITTVSGYATALSDGMIAPEKQQEYLDAIRSKSARMNDLIALLFDYVKLDSDGFVLSRDSLDLCELVRENAALLYSDIEDAQMELDIEIPERRIEVLADRIQFSRVVTNLLVNVVRHNPQGTRIALQVREEYGQVQIAVADTGACMEDELVRHLFEPFARGDSSRSGAGSGLGLSIAQKIVQMHGWELMLVQQPRLQKYRGLERYAKAFIIAMDNP